MPESKRTSDARDVQIMLDAVREEVLRLHPMPHSASSRGGSPTLGEDHLWIDDRKSVDDPMFL